MKTAIALLTLALCISNGAFASRSLSQLPTLGAPASGPAAAAPAPLTGGQCALGALEQSGNFTLLLDLIAAASESSLLQGLLNSASEMATVFAPTDGGIEKTAAQQNISPEDLMADPEQITSILQYHILPSQLAAKDLQNGFSFNTLYEVNNIAQSVAIQGNGVTATVQGSASSAPIIGSLTACNFAVYPIDGLLLSNTKG